MEQDRLVSTRTTLSVLPDIKHGPGMSQRDHGDVKTKFQLALYPGILPNSIVTPVLTWEPDAIQPRIVVAVVVEGEVERAGSTPLYG